MKKEVILSSAYLAPVEYYTKLFAYDTIHIEQFDHYMKQTYRNRCTIASADGSLSLTIPTEKSDDLKCLMKDVRISDHGNWRHVHWNAFVAAYKQSPFSITMLMSFIGFMNIDMNSCSILIWTCVTGYVNRSIYILPL